MFPLAAALLISWTWWPGIHFQDLKSLKFDFQRFAATLDYRRRSDWVCDSFSWNRWRSWSRRKTRCWPGWMCWSEPENGTRPKSITSLRRRDTSARAATRPYVLMFPITDVLKPVRDQDISFETTVQKVFQWEDLLIDWFQLSERVL